VFNDVVLRLEPRHETRHAIPGDFPKANERSHLVNVVADRLMPLKGPGDIGIDHDLEQLRFAVGNSPKQPVEQCPTAFVRMERDQLCGLQKFFWDAKPAGSAAVP